MTAPYDLVILGSGTTAFAGALKGVEKGARVLLVEQSTLGGTCVNWGCIPSKTLIHKAEVQRHPRRAEQWGLNLRAGPPDWRRLMAAKKVAVETVRRENYLGPLNAHPEIDILRGHGRFLSPRELQVGDETVVAERFLIACGGNPRILRLPGVEEIDYLTSYSALHLERFPKSLIIIGGGVIALEMGQMFCRFGTEVTVVERGERALKEFDPRLSGIFQELLEEEGMSLIFNAETQRVFKDGDGSALVAQVQGEERTLRAERIMFAIGTEPATSGIGLEKAGVKVDEGGFIVTDAECRTTAANIWAAGDAIGGPLIAPAGACEAEVAVENLLDPSAHARVDHRHIPMAVFVEPEFATVGMSGEQARQAGLEVVETFLDLGRVAKAHVLGAPRGAILLWAERGTGRLLGAQLLVPRAADIIHEATLAVRLGLSVRDLARTVHTYPSISDGLRLAALENLRQQQAETGAYSP